MHAFESFLVHGVHLHGIVLYYYVVMVHLPDECSILCVVTNGAPHCENVGFLYCIVHNLSHNCICKLKSFLGYGYFRVI
jgi:hypothetical protein